MTLLEEIYEAAAQAAPSGADEELLQRLCRISAAQWQARLKAGVMPGGVYLRGGMERGSRIFHAAERRKLEH